MNLKTGYIHYLLVTFVFLTLTSCGETDGAKIGHTADYVCEDTLGCIIIEKDKPVKIGVLQALEGPVSPFGIDQLRGVELAIQRYGDRIGRHPIKIVSANSGCSKNNGIAGARKLVSEDDIAGIIGATCSSASAEAARIVSEAGLVMISGSSTAPSLTALKGERGELFQPGFFRTCYNDADKGKTLALFILRILQKQKAAIIYGNDPYAVGMKEVLEYELLNLDGLVRYTFQIDQNKNDINWDNIIEGIISSGAEVVILPLFQPFGELFLEAADKYDDFKDIILVADDTLLLDSIVSRTREFKGDFYFISPALDPMRPADAVFSAYRVKYQAEPTGISFIYAYDAASVLLEGIEKSAVIGKDECLIIGRQKLRDSMNSIAGFWGVSGLIESHSNGDLGASRFSILYQDKKRTTVKEIHDSVVYSFDKLKSEISITNNPQKW